MAINPNENPELIENFCSDGTKDEIPEFLKVSGYTPENPNPNGYVLNKIFNQIFQQLNHQKEKGFAFWESTKNYTNATNNIDIVRRNNKIYYAKSDNINKSPENNPNDWGLMFDFDNPNENLFLGINAKAVDSDKLDGLNSSAFLRANAKAVDSDKLDGLNSSAFLRANAKAVDSDKLDGLNSSDFLRQSRIISNSGNINNKWYKLGRVSGNFNSQLRIDFQAKNSYTSSVQETGGIIFVEIGNGDSSINNIGVNCYQFGSSAIYEIAVKQIDNNLQYDIYIKVGIYAGMNISYFGNMSFEPFLNNYNSVTKPDGLIDKTSNLKMVLTDESNSFGGNRSNGYQKLNNGLMIQWHFINIGGDRNQDVTWPVAFPNNCFSCVATFSDGFNDSDSYLGVYNLRRDKYTIANGQGFVNDIMVWGIGN